MKESETAKYLLSSASTPKSPLRVVALVVRKPAVRHAAGADFLAQEGAGQLRPLKVSLKLFTFMRRQL